MPKVAQPKQLAPIKGAYYLQDGDTVSCGADFKYVPTHQPAVVTSDSQKISSDSFELVDGTPAAWDEKPFQFCHEEDEAWLDCQWDDRGSRSTNPNWGRLYVMRD